MLKRYGKWILVIAVFFLFQLCLQYGYPMTSDDLYFRHAVDFDGFGQMLDYVLHFGSGRFLGNLGTMLTVRNEWLRIFWKSLGMTAMYGGLLYLLPIRKIEIALLGAGLLLFPSVKMYAQVYVWTMGFQIYVMPIAIFIMALICRTQIKKAGGWIRTVLLSAVIFSLSLISQLFVEHCTLIFLLISLFLAVSDYRKKEKAYLLVGDGVLIVGNLIGAALMFLGPSLLGGDTGGVEGYRQVPATIVELAASIYHNGASAGRYLSGCLGVWAALMWGVLQENEREKGNIVGKVLESLVIGLTGFSAVHLVALEEVIRKGTDAVYFIVFLTQLCFLLIFLGYSLKRRKRKAALGVSGAIVSILPLMVVSPISPRVFFLSWFFLFSTALLIFEQRSEEKKRLFQCSTIRMLLLGMGIALAVISAEWRYGNELRIIYVERMTRENPKMREISLPRLPNGRLLQADADSNYWNYVLKDYLGLDPDGPEKIDITWYDWYNWLDVKDEE